MRRKSQVELDDISLVGFSNAPHSAFVTPPMTAVVQPIHEMGRLAAELLMRQITEGQRFIPETHVLNTQLII